MNLYNVIDLEKQIEYIAEHNEGEIPEDKLQQLIEAQTQSIVQIENLIKYIRHLELGIDMCKHEEERISAMRKKAENRIESIKKYLTPYVDHKGKVEAGTFKLSIRKSEQVIITDASKLSLKYQVVIPETLQIDKNAIKKDLKAGIAIPGTELKVNSNLQIK